MRAVPILLYHTVSTTPSPVMRPFTVSPSAFGRHLEAVAESGATVLTVSDFVTHRGNATLPERPAVITFDDGFADFAEHALPALTEWGLPSVLYVTTGFLEGAPGARVHARPSDATLHWSQLTGIAASGVEIGAHSHSHPYLDTLSPTAAREEIVRSKALLEDELGHAVESFAYPNGYASHAIRRLVRGAGFRSACAVRNTFSSTHDDPFALARLTVRDTTTVDELAGWLAGSGAPGPRVGERFKTRAWRAYRRTKAVASGAPGSDFR